MPAPPSPLSPGVLFALLAAGLLFAAGIVGFAASDAVAPVSPELATFLSANWGWLIGAGFIVDSYALLTIMIRKRAAVDESSVP